MQIGVVYPQSELGGDPDAARRYGTAVEALGFDHILAYDHVLGAVHANRSRPLTGIYDEHDPFHDPFVMFNYLAGITERIQFATGILILPQRPTALVARQAADLDLFSHGRFRLGVGVGWNHVEYEALGQDFTTRGARQEEQIGLLRRLFTEPSWTSPAGSTTSTAPPSPENRPGRSRSGSADPGPSRSTAPPVSPTGSSSSVAALGTTSTPGTNSAPRVADHHRPVETFGGDYVALNPTGDVDTLADEIDTWRLAGGTHVSIVTTDLGHRTVEEHTSTTSPPLPTPSAPAVLRDRHRHQRLITLLDRSWKADWWTKQGIRDKIGAGHSPIAVMEAVSKS